MCRLRRVGRVQAAPRRLGAGFATSAWCGLRRVGLVRAAPAGNGKNCDSGCGLEWKKLPLGARLRLRARGIGIAEAHGMADLGIGNLIVWQLANDYKKAVYELAAKPPSCLDRSYAGHLRRTAASVELNVVEGYHRRGPRDFARFLTIARASLAETDAQLHDGIDRGHFQPAHLATTNAIARRLVPAIMALRRALLAKAAQ